MRRVVLLLTTGSSVYRFWRQKNKKGLAATASSSLPNAVLEPSGAATNSTLGTSFSSRDPGPVERLRELQRDPNAAALILDRLQDGSTLLQLARDWKLPRHAFLSWIAANGELTEQCKRVRELAGIELRMEGLDIVDGATPETAPVAKIQADYREKLSRDLNKPLFGKFTQYEHRHTFDLGDRLRRAREREADPRPVLEAEVIETTSIAEPIAQQEPPVEAATHVAPEPPPI